MVMQLLNPGQSNTPVQWISWINVDGLKETQFMEYLWLIWPNSTDTIIMYYVSNKVWEYSHN